MVIRINILVIGGYGFIGSKIVEKLVKERYIVTIIDNLSTGDVVNVKLKHNSIIFDVENKEVEKYFMKIKFDVIIYAINNINGLKNVLKLSKEYEIKKFIFLSSYLVYKLNKSNIEEFYSVSEENKISSTYLNCEKTCSESYDQGLDVKILRLANIYGPNMKEDKNNLISMVLENQKLLIKSVLEGSTDGYQDYIYVSDVADAVFKSIQNNGPLFMNISSNKKIYNKKIVDISDKISIDNNVEVATVIYNNESFTMNNNQAKSSIGWYPITEIEIGMKKTYKWLSKQNKDKKTETKKVRRNPKIYYFFENILLFFIFLIFQIFLKEKLKIDIDIMYIYIISSSIFYGFEIGSIAAVLASLLFVYSKLANGRDIIYIFFELQNVFQIVVYVIIAIVSGYTSDKKDYHIRSVRRELKDSESELKFIKNIYDKSIEIKNVLQYEIENYEDSFSKLFDIIDRLNNIPLEEVSHEAVYVISETMHSDSVFLYSVEKNNKFGRKIAYIGENEKFNNSIILEEENFLTTVIEEKEIFINRNLERGFPMVAAPIIYNNEITAIVLLDNIEFEYLSLHYVNMLKTLMMLLANIIESATIYQNAIADKKYYNNTLIIRKKWFKNIIEQRKKGEKKYLNNTVLIKLDLSIEKGINDYNIISKLIRLSDFIGETEDDKVAIVFSNMNDKVYKSVRDRFTKKGYVFCEGDKE